MKSELVCLVIVGLVLHEALSSPLPQFSLTEEEFRSFPDEESPPNKVDIVSGYAKIRRQGRHHSGRSISFSRPLTVRDPLEFAASSRGLPQRNNQRGRPADNFISRFPEMQPVFKLSDMLAKEAATLKAKVEEASLMAAKATEEAEANMKALAQKAIAESTVGKVEVESILEQAIDSAINEAEDIIASEDSTEVAEAATDDDLNEVEVDLDNDNTTAASSPSSDVDLGSVQEV